MVLKAPTDDRFEVIAEAENLDLSGKLLGNGDATALGSNCDLCPLIRRQYDDRTFDRMLTEIRDLAPAIAARVTDIETDRRVPVDLVETLRSIGVFRMFVPRSHGGLELDVAELLEIIAALGRIEASVGWIAMIGSGAAIFAPMLPRETYNEIYDNGPDVIYAGLAAANMGTAEATQEGLRVRGRWPFASGCQHADWIFGACTMTENGTPFGVRPAHANMAGFWGLKPMSSSRPSATRS